MTYGQVGEVCPQCGRADTVHSVEELAAFARSRLAQRGLRYQMPQGYQAQPGYQAPVGPPPPQPSGFPAPSSSPGFPAPPPPPPPPPPPDYGDSKPPPGYSGQRRPSRWSGSNRPASSSSSRPASSSSSSSDDSIEDAVAGLVMDAATKFVGRAISRRLKRTFDERVAPAMAARQEGMLREQIAIAERYPDLRACLSDQVVFLAGGSRVVPVPMSSLADGFTLEQADAVVAQLRNG